jgi:phosphinothricin acetyltransferase
MMTVRAFRLSDYEAVLALDIAEQMAYRGVQWEAATEDERTQLLMTSPRNRRVCASSDYCFVAEEDGAVIGFLFALPLLPDVLVIDGVGVASEKRKRGVASSMYAALLARARERGVRRIQALITPDNEASMALHKAAGFDLRDRKEAVIELG